MGGSLVPQAVCPECGVRSQRRHGWRQRCLQDYPAHGEVVTVDLRDCRRETFSDLASSAAAPYARRTLRAVQIASHLGHVAGGRPAERLMRRLGIPVSDDTILRHLKRVARGNAPPARIIGIDDCSWRRSTRYGTIARDSGRTGWLYLPNLDRLPNTISDFTAALLSYYRGDFGQAAQYFGRVAERPAVQTATRGDAEVLALISRTRNGEDVGDAWHRLLDADSDSLYVWQAATMAKLARALSGPPASRPAALGAIGAALARNRSLFDAEDGWARSVEAIIHGS